MTSDETIPAFESARTSVPDGGRVCLPQIGELVLDRYRIEGELGRGGQAVVFEAFDVQLDRRVALKVLAPSFADPGNDEWLGLLEEARLQAAVEVPGIARLLDAQQDSQRSYLVLELVPGKDLKEVFTELRSKRMTDGFPPKDGNWLATAAGAPNESPPNPWKSLGWDMTVANFGLELVRSISALHQRGMIHLDLKPGNIKLNDQCQPIVLDFGLARWLGSPQNSRLIGTIGYLAPEQVPGLHGKNSSVGAQTDMFQIGIILFELLALERAYPTDMLRDYSRYSEFLQTCSLRSAHSIYPKADPGLVSVIAKATAIQPENRYPSLAEFALDLQCVCRRLPPRHARTSFSFRARRMAVYSARTPIGALFLAALVLIPSVWATRDAFINEVTSLEGWRYSADSSVVAKIGVGSKVKVGDDLGVRISNSKPTVVYALSVFGGNNSRTRYVSPMRSVPLIDGVPQSTNEALWGLSLAAGEHEVICSRITEYNPYEGLLVFACAEPAPVLEEWLKTLDAIYSLDSIAMSQKDAFMLLDDIQNPIRVRGKSPRGSLGKPDEAALKAERERYAGFTTAKAAGDEKWDLGAAMVRVEFICEVDL
ncbi:MAG: serine/threonine protein kinase [Planctomycetes bacterium]|nr:serine/threonine protein kinase [Planctomycetota bacterium]